MFTTKHGRWRVLIPVAAVATLISACGGTAGNQGAGGGEDVGEPQNGGEVVMAMNIESQTLDPAWCSYIYDRCAPIFGTLLEYDAEQDEILPAMAESFESEDGMTWTLKLRPEVEFSDGTAYDAEAVAYNWSRIKDPETLTTAGELIAPLTWEVVDPYTLEVTSEAANFQLPWSLSQGLGMIGSPTAMEEMGADYGNAPIGAGPFLLESWTRDVEARYTANPTYWEEGLPYLDNFVLKVIKPDDQRMNALRAQEIDIAWSMQSKDKEAMESAGFIVNELPLVGGTGLNFNFEDPDLQNPQLRLALQSTLDSQQIVDAVYPTDVPADAFLRPDNQYRDDDLGVYPVKDLEMAQELFDGYLQESGQSGLELGLVIHAGIPDLLLLAQVLQSQLQQIDGLTVNIEPVDYGTLEPMRRAGNFQLILGSLLTQNMDAMYDNFHTDGQANVANYSNPVVDQALEITRMSNDATEVEEAYELISGEISKDAPIRTGRYSNGYMYTGNSIQGLKVIGVPSGAGVIMDEVWISE